MDVVFHLAAAVGVGQSMYRIADYAETNTQATAKLLQLLVDGGHELERLVVASSMSIYGEGRYRTADGRADPGRVRRTTAQLEEDRWEPADAGPAPEALPTDEDKGSTPPRSTP